MLKKALASAGIAVAILGAGAGTATAAPAPGQDKKADEGHNVVCDAKGPSDKADYAGILSDEMLKLPIIDKSVILGLCGHKAQDDKGGKPGEKPGEGNETPKPGKGNGGGGSFPAAL